MSITKEQKNITAYSSWREFKRTLFTGEVDFDALVKKNKDVKAWIYSKDTVINYPVVQGKDNQYYLYRMINGEWNGKGSIFIDYRCENPF